MSGYMVSAESQAHRAFYMVNTDRPDWACEEVNRLTGLNNAQALSPLSDETIAHFDIRSTPWLCFTTDLSTGEVSSTRFGQEMAY